MSTKTKKEKAFTPYQIFIIAIIGCIQFAIVLDFMVLSPLGPMLLHDLSISSQQFSLVVSAYAFSAGISGFLAAGFADKFDRKRLLLFFLSGFILGTLCCAMATNYHFLLIARIVTGIFGGVIGSITFAIISDLFVQKVRGRVMGFVQMSFAVSQVLGLPIGLFLANKFNWHFPFYAIVGFALVVMLLIAFYMKPITAHIEANKSKNAFQHISNILSNKGYAKAFLVTTVLATGGYMLMPFGTIFATGNLGLSMHDLPMLYAITGVATMIAGPTIGMLSDKLGAYKMFIFGSILTAVMVAIYTQLNITPFWIVVVVNVFLFAGITGRMVSYSTLMTSIPKMQDRGAFMSVNSSIQQLSGGVAAILAGFIAYESDGKMENYPLLGLTMITSVVLGAILMYRVAKMIKIAKTAEERTADIPL